MTYPIHLGKKRIIGSQHGQNMCQFNVHVFSTETSGQYISECKYTNSLSIND